MYQCVRKYSQVIAESFQNFMISNEFQLRQVHGNFIGLRNPELK
jgi:hypothetical protein